MSLKFFNIHENLYPQNESTFKVGEDKIGRLRSRGWEIFGRRWTESGESWKLNSFHGGHMCIAPNWNKKDPKYCPIPALWRHLGTLNTLIALRHSKHSDPSVTWELVTLAELYLVNALREFHHIIQIYSQALLALSVNICVHLSWCCEWNERNM